MTDFTEFQKLLCCFWSPARISGFLPSGGYEKPGCNHSTLDIFFREVRGWSGWSHSCQGPVNHKPCSAGQGALNDPPECAHVTDFWTSHHECVGACGSSLWSPLVMLLVLSHGWIIPGVIDMVTTSRHGSDRGGGGGGIDIVVLPWLQQQQQ